MEIFSYHQDSRYGASSDGQIWSRATTKGKMRDEWRPIKPTVDSNGYHSMKIWVNGKRQGLRIHRFVWECFNGPIVDDKEINHKDKNKGNNSICNLELVTHSENMKHAAAAHGEKNPMAKFNKDTIEAIRFLHGVGWSGAKIARSFGISDAYIHRIVFNKVWNTAHIT